jgi:DnaK suppressor protein
VRQTHFNTQTPNEVTGVPSANKTEQLKQSLEQRVAEAQRVLASATEETRTYAARHPDAADQALAEYERQTLTHKAATAQQQIENLNRALQRIAQGSYGVCAECGGDIEPKRLEALPWAQYCVVCQEARERTHPA